MPKQPISIEELALLDAIHDDPRNDGPRLAYADWLEAHELPGFAEFIRLQCREPYFMLTVHEKPRVDTMTYWIKYDDPARANRAIDLLTPLQNSDRFPQTRLFEQVVRGLPRYEDEREDSSLPLSVSDLYPDLSPLARFSISLRTGRLSEWLGHPLMRFVDVLRIFPEGDFDPENDVMPEFTDDDIILLEQTPLLDRLEELGLCAHLEEDVRELVEKRLQPRVPVDNSW